jgi:hypothetical protein
MAVALVMFDQVEGEEDCRIGGLTARLPLIPRTSLPRCDRFSVHKGKPGIERPAGPQKEQVFLNADLSSK